MNEDLPSSPLNRVLGESKTVLPDEESLGLGVYDQTLCKQKGVEFRRFGVKNPSHSENIVAKKWYTLMP